MILIKTLLRTNLENFARLLDRATNQLVFFDRQGKRLLAKNMFAGEKRFNRDFDVPMVRRRNTDDLDIVSFQYAAIILRDNSFRRLFYDGVPVSKPLRFVKIDVR